MKYSTQHKYQCSEAYEKWALKNIKNVIHKPTARQAYMAACRTCIEGFNEWISVSDRLPHMYDKVLVHQDTGAIFVGMWETENYWLSVSDLEIQPPTHWMPLPEPPIAPATGTKTPEE